MTTTDEDNGTAGQRRKIHILVDGEYRLTVTRDFWAGQNIRSGDELDDAEFAAFCEAAGSCRAFNAAVDILSRRDHSSKELERKVARRSGAEFAREAVERLEELGYVDDERYAHTLAQELYERRGMGKKRIEQELRQRGISRETACECTEELDGDDAERIKSCSKLNSQGVFRRKGETAHLQRPDPPRLRLFRYPLGHAAGGRGI